MLALSSVTTADCPGPRLGVTKTASRVVARLCRMALHLNGPLQSDAPPSLFNVNSATYSASKRKDDRSLVDSLASKTKQYCPCVANRKGIPQYLSMQVSRTQRRSGGCCFSVN